MDIKDATGEDSEMRNVLLEAKGEVFLLFRGKNLGCMYLIVMCKANL